MALDNVAVHSTCAVAKKIVYQKCGHKTTITMNTTTNGAITFGSTEEMAGQLEIIVLNAYKFAVSTGEHSYTTVYIVNHTSRVLL